MQDDRAPTPLDPLEDLVARCLDGIASHGRRAVEELLAAHPEQADDVRRRLASLDRVGLIGDGLEEIPVQIGRYRIERRLGQGGMSVVYLAEDPRVGRRVALKTVPLLAGERRLARFEREIRAAAGLQHPGFVPIFDVGVADGRPFFTMEYVEGVTLADVVEGLGARGVPFEEITGGTVREIVARRVDAAEDATEGHGWRRNYVEWVCRLVLDVAEALEHAHRAGVVHRDVKPSNILIRADGRAQLFDLGLAHLADQPELTLSGDFTGTPYYVSPEQIAGPANQVDARTDVFSLGVTFFELLALQRPFQGNGTVAVLREIQGKEPPLLRRLNPLVPRDLETVVLTAIEKDRDRRYPGMGEMAADLARFLEFRPVRARPIGELRRALRVLRRNPPLAAASGLAALVALGLPAGLLWANAAIREQRDAAEAQAREASHQAQVRKEVIAFLESLFRVAESAPGETGGPHPVDLEELDRTAERLASDFGDDAFVRASLMQALGQVYKNLGNAERALPLLDRAFAVLHRERGEAHPESASVLSSLAAVHLALGNSAAALALGRRSLDSLAAAGAGASWPAAECRLTVAAAAAQLGDDAFARACLDDALAIAQATDAGPADRVALVLEHLGRFELDRADADAAAELARTALDVRRELWSPDPLALAETLELLAGAEERRGAARAADQRREEAEALRGSFASSVPEGAAGAGDVVLPFDLTPDWKPRFDAAFQAGITALQSGQYRSAIEAFERCLAWDPRMPVCAYNLACAHALSGEVGRGLDWFAKAAEFGFGYSDARMEVALKDADLSALRPDPRFAATLERMQAQRRAAAAYAARPVVVLPAETPAEGLAVLVVLHADGATKDDVAAGPWGRAARELGLALLAPSAPIPAAERPEAGMRWFEDLEAYRGRPGPTQDPVLEALRAFAAEHEIDRGRVLIAGEREGGLVALDVALRAPGVFRGVLLANAPVHPETSASRTRTAAFFGLAVEVLVDPARPLPGCAPEGRAALAGALGEWLARRGLGGPTAVRVEAGPWSPEREAQLLAEALGALAR